MPNFQGNEPEPPVARPHAGSRFTMNEAYTNEGIESQPCIPFSICAIMRNTHPLARKDKVTYYDLLKHGIIMPDVGERVSTLSAIFAERSHPIKRKVYPQ